MIAIRAEIDAIGAGEADKKNNLLKNAPHTIEQSRRTNGIIPYSREQAAWPAEWTRAKITWKAVARIDSVYGATAIFSAPVPRWKRSRKNRPLGEVDFPFHVGHGFPPIPTRSPRFSQNNSPPRGEIWRAKSSRLSRRRDQVGNKRAMRGAGHRIFRDARRPARK